MTGQKKWKPKASLEGEKKEGQASRGVTPSEANGTTLDPGPSISSRTGSGKRRKTTKKTDYQRGFRQGDREENQGNETSRQQIRSAGRIHKRNKEKQGKEAKKGKDPKKQDREREQNEAKKMRKGAQKSRPGDTSTTPHERTNDKKISPTRYHPKKIKSQNPKSHLPAHHQNNNKPPKPVNHPNPTHTPTNHPKISTLPRPNPIDQKKQKIK